MEAKNKNRQSNSQGFSFIWGILVEIWPDGVFEHEGLTTVYRAMVWTQSKTPFDQKLTKIVQIKLNLQLLDCLFAFMAFISHSLVSLVLYWSKGQKMSLNLFHIYGHILMQLLSSDPLDGIQLRIAALICPNMTPWRMNCNENRFPTSSPPIFSLW